MSTTLKEFTDNGNSRTYTFTGHTAEQPKLVIQKRTVPTGNQVMLEDVISTIEATTDADGAVMQQKVLISTTVRRPIGGNSTILSGALAVHRDIIASDEFTNVVDTQEFVA
jgi:hypothetical protein